MEAGLDATKVAPMTATITVAIGTCVSDKLPKNRTFDTLEEFEAFVTRPPTILAGLTPEHLGSLRFKTAKNSLPYMVGGPTNHAPDPVSGGHRGKDNFPVINVVILDVDQADETLTAEIKTGTGTLAGLRYAWHTTPSATADMPKFRVYLPLADPIPGHRQAALYLAIKAAMDTDTAKVDEKSKGAAHIMFGPGHVEGGYFENGVNVAPTLLDGLGILADIPDEKPRAKPERPQEPRSAPQGGAPHGDDLDANWRVLMQAAGAVITDSPRRPGREETTHCPWHDDNTPSLDIKPTGEMVCRAGCTAQDGHNPSWLRYVAQVRGETLSQATKWARSIVGGQYQRDYTADFDDMGADTPPGGAAPGEESDGTGGDAPAPDPRIAAWIEYVKADDKKAARGPITLRKYGDLLGEVANDDDREIFGRWIYRGEFALLVAGGGFGKSRFSFALAYALAQGEPFLGLNRRNPTPLATLILDGEDEAIYRVASGAGTVVADAPVYFTTEDAGTLDKRRLLDVGRAVIRHRIDMVLIDTVLGSLDVESENDAKAVEDALKPLRKFAAVFGVAVVGLHHTSKSGFGAGRGSSSFRNVVHHEFRITLAAGEPAKGIEFNPADITETTDLALESLKIRGKARPERLIFRRSGAYGYQVQTGFDELDRDEEEDTSSPIDRGRAVMDIINGAGVDGVKLGYLTERLVNSSRRSISNSLAWMIDAGMIEKRGQHYYRRGSGPRGGNEG